METVKGTVGILLLGGDRYQILAEELELLNDYMCPDDAKLSWQLSVYQFSFASVEVSVLYLPIVSVWVSTFAPLEFQELFKMNIAVHKAGEVFSYATST